MNLDNLVKLKDHVGEKILAHIDDDGDLHLCSLNFRTTGCFIAKESLPDLIKLLLPRKKYSKFKNQQDSWNLTPENELNQRG